MPDFPTRVMVSADDYRQVVCALWALRPCNAMTLSTDMRIGYMQCLGLTALRMLQSLCIVGPQSVSGSNPHAYRYIGGFVLDSHSKLELSQHLLTAVSRELNYEFHVIRISPTMSPSAAGTTIIGGGSGGACDPNSDDKTTLGIYQQMRTRLYAAAKKAAVALDVQIPLP